MSISCETCREYLPLLSELPAGESLKNLAPLVAGVDGAPSPSLIESHLATCADCSRELAFLSSIRREVTAIPTMAAPSELRSKIRARLQQEAEAAPANLGITAAAPVMITPKPKQVSSLERWTQGFSSFFRRPSNVAWASSAALA
ncbi:MAG TPA: hypothetical protein VF719_05795, partial [Abditibacteriaceae bacterium]